jgi:hypothetical protein
MLPRFITESRQNPCPEETRIGVDQLIVIRGAVSAGRLEVVTPFLLTVTTTGTSPAPAKEAGSWKLIMSNPGMSGLGRTERIAVPVIAVVPTVTVTSLVVALRTPVTVSSITVGTVAPPASVDVTLKGSAVRAFGSVTLKAIARPFASPLVEKMSGWPPITARIRGEVCQCWRRRRAG